MFCCACLSAELGFSLLTTMQYYSEGSRFLIYSHFSVSPLTVTSHALPLCKVGISNTGELTFGLFIAEAMIAN